MKASIRGQKGECRRFDALRHPLKKAGGRNVATPKRNGPSCTRTIREIREGPTCARIVSKCLVHDRARCVPFTQGLAAPFPGDRRPPVPFAYPHSHEDGF